MVRSTDFWIEPWITQTNLVKDVFITKVMRGRDTNSEHWKAKFIDGLPPFFAKKS